VNPRPRNLQVPLTINPSCWVPLAQVNSVRPPDSFHDELLQRLHLWMARNDMSPTIVRENRLESSWIRDRLVHPAPDLSSRLV
jgi:hypothetical protein